MSSPLRRQDSTLRWVLVALAAAFLTEVWLVNLIGGGGLLLALSSWVGGFLLFCIALLGYFRDRYSMAGLALFSFPIVIFQAWTGIAFWVAVWTWSPSSPLYYLGLLEASAAVPLFAGIYAMSRRLSATA
jgi:hypothetical protein